MSDCCVFGCINDKHTIAINSISTFSLPEERERLEAWSRIIGREDILSEDATCYRICEAHFDRCMFIDPKDSKKGLKATAVPALDLPILYSEECIIEPKLEPDDETEELQFEPQWESDETVEFSFKPNSDPDDEVEEFDIEQTKSEHDDVTEECMFQPKQEQDNETISPHENEFQEAEIFALEQEISNILSSNATLKKGSRDSLKQKFKRWQKILLSRYKKNKYEYNKKFRLFCLNLYCNAPKAYTLFKKCLALPSPKTLQNTKLILCNGVRADFTNLFNLLSAQLSKMPENSKYITVCLDEIPLRKNIFYDIRNDVIVGFQNLSKKNVLEAANQALIIKIKGCVQDYEQVIAYSLTGPSTYDYFELSEWVLSIIELLCTNGFVVCAFIAKQTYITTHFALSCGVTTEKPYLQVCNMKVYFVFDIPDLMNSIRDNFLECDFVYDKDKFASWEYVKMFYSKDIKRKIRLAPKLTSAHVSPLDKQKTNRELTKQVFSYTVAAGISADIEAGHLSPEASETADFLMYMNELYDLLDLTRDRSKHNNIGTQTIFLQDSCTMFQHLRAINRITREELMEEVNCFLAAVITIKSVLALRKQFIEIGIKYFPTRRLHSKHEKILSFFENQKNKKSLCTPIQIRRYFPKLFLKQIMKNSLLRNCSSNIDSLIFGAESICNDFTLLEKYFPKAPKTSPLVVGCTDYRFSMSTVWTINYVSCYLLYRCSKVHECGTFKKYLKHCSKFINADTDRAPEHVKDFVVPPKSFIDYIHRCEWFFIDYFGDPQVILKDNVGEKTLQNIGKVTPRLPCPCFPLDYLQKLFIRLRIYNTIKNRNLNIKINRIAYYE